jgi:hypothetical protein
MLLLASVAVAGPETITNYLPVTDYLFVTNTFADAGDTGLPTGQHYVCFKLGALSNLASNQADNASASSDIRAVIRSLNDKFYTVLQAVASTNRPENQTVSYNVSYTGDTNAPLTETFSVKTKLSIGTVTLPAE